jgi:hypothetical protein
MEISDRYADFKYRDELTISIKPERAKMAKAFDMLLLMLSNGKPRHSVMYLLPAVIVVFLLGSLSVANAQSDESRCSSLVQGQIAWDYQGSTSWNPTNVENLCRGTLRPRQPGRCFNRAMHGGINWGGGTQWEWKNALNLCAGTDDADETISCFQSKIREGVAWPEAIRACNESRCSSRVQGQIAWDYQGSTSWNPTNVQNLCRGASNPTQPAQCFNRAMHGGINWGGGTQWEWKNALNLCAGTNNADATISCFQTKIREGVGWPDAIRICKSAGR